ncbi:hypothetical protein BRC64_01840 [Halobacteriales archaeon QH_10_67_22]|nr:MAG: hypothetical protein BRC64_01840 [Halobacteriales archaeon QH_10_67_22]
MNDSTGDSTESEQTDTTEPGDRGVETDHTRLADSSNGIAGNHRIRDASAPDTVQRFGSRQRSASPRRGMRENHGH